MVVFVIAAASPASAHTNYGGFARNLGPGTTTGTVADPITGFSVSSPYFKSITVANIATDSGWAHGTLPEFGDAHHIRAFRFTLAEAGFATIRAEAVSSGFLPGFTLYSGLLDLSNGSPADGEVGTVAYLESLGAPQPRAGALNSLGYVEMYSAAGVKSALDYFGHAADGNSGNFGSASGISGDGTADGIVEYSSYLLAGDYTIFLGGANINGTSLATNLSSSLSLTVIPEPSGILLLGISGLGLALRRRRA